MRGHSAAVSRYSSSAVVCSPVCVCVWTLLLTSSPFTPLRLSHLPFSLSLSPPPSIAFVLLPFALPYIVLAISQSTNGSYSSISGGDLGPLGKRGWKPCEYRKAFYLSLSLFSSVSLMFPFPRSLSLSLPLLSHSLSYSPRLCLRRLLWKPGCMLNGVRRCAALPIAAYANRIISSAPDCVASLTHLHLSPASAKPIQHRPAGLGWVNTEIRGCGGEAWGLWNKDVSGALVYSTRSALRV